MLTKHPHQSFLSKALHLTDQGLKVWGVAHGVYSAATGIARGVRAAYQVAAPVIAAAQPALSMSSLAMLA
jgi:hypothetical protein